MFVWENIDIIRVIFFVLFGLVISYSDIRRGKISNLHIILMMSVGFALFFLAGTYDLFPSLLINFVLALAVGFIFWRFGIWGAGDAKFFAAGTLYLPIKMYLSFFYAQVVIVNFFILSFFIWFLPLFIKTSRFDKLNSLKLALRKDSILKLAMLVFGLFFFIGNFFNHLGFGLYETGYFITLVFSLVAYAILQNVLSSKLNYLLVFFCLARLFFDNSVFLFSFWTLYFATLGIILLVTWFTNLSVYLSYEEKRIKDLVVGDIPGGIMAEKGDKLDLEGFLNKFGSKDRILREGFSREDIKKLKKGWNIPGFLVKKYIRFTPIIMASFLLLFALGIDIMLSIISHMHYFIFGG